MGGFLVIMGLLALLYGALGLALGRRVFPGQVAQPRRTAVGICLVALLTLAIGGNLLPDPNSTAERPEKRSPTTVAAVPTREAAPKALGGPEIAQPTKATASTATFIPPEPEFEDDQLKVLRSRKMPAIAGEAPSTGCYGAAAGDDHKICVTDALGFRKKEWPLAWRGDYQAARNVAYCLSTGCSGSVQQNRIQGCAWRLAISQSGLPDVNDMDVMSLKTECRQIDDSERLAAQAAAARILETAFGR